MPNDKTLSQAEIDAMLSGGAAGPPPEKTVEAEASSQESPPQETADTSQDVQADHGVSGRKKILVAEDSQDTRVLISRILSSGGYNIIETEDGKET